MGGGRIDPGDDDELITQINVTPLVDVVLVLLIILMVTATAIVSKTIPMDLPTGETGVATPMTLSVSIDDQSNLYLDARRVSDSQLRRGIRAAHAQDAEVRAVIAADGSVQHRTVVRVIDLLRQEHVTKFAINVRPSDLER